MQILLDNPGFEALILAQQKYGRFRPTTTFNSPVLNQMLGEFAPTNRVMSGEAIVFQNEMLDIFREVINLSTHPIICEEIKNDDIEVPQNNHAAQHLKPKYVIAMILEFLRTLLENSIPQQPSQQAMIIKYIIKVQDYPTLHSLL